jgi:WD40 repeat protein
LAYSPDGRRLASSSRDGGVKVWDPAAGEELLSLTGDAGAYHCVAFSPDGKRLFAGYDGGVRIWEGAR